MESNNYSEMNVMDFVTGVFDDMKKKVEKLHQLNIMVVGRSGVGKSTMINNMFRENLAETGIGNRVTTHMKKYSKPGYPLSIYDTKGFELGQKAQEEVKEEILETVNKGLKSGDYSQAIHCILYCINTSSNRIDDEEIKWIKEFTEENSKTNVPVIIVLTQAFSKDNASKMRDYLLELNLNVKNIVPVLSEDYLIDENYTVKHYGLDRLVEIIMNCLDSDLMYTLSHVQSASIKHKVKLAQAAVGSATVAAAAAAATPIPFSDAALLIPTQIGMISTITVIFGLEINKSILTAFVSSVLGTSGATLAGKSLASSLLKLVPGVGTILGGAISATTAGLITTVLGEAYIQLMVLVVKGEMKKSDLNTEIGRKKMEQLIKEQINKNK